LKLTAQKMLADLSVKVSGANYILSWDNKTSGPHRVGSFPSQIFDDLGLPRDDPAIIQVLSEKISEAERSPDITLDELANLFPIVDEFTNTKAIILSILSTRLPVDWRIRCVYVEGPNSSGKNYVVKTIIESLRGLPEFVEISSMTEGYFKRALPDDLDGRIIYFTESSGLPENFHSLLSESMFKYFYLEQKANGGFEPVEKITRGTPLIIFTNNYYQSLSIDFKHRALRLVMDDSPEQTRRILEFQARLARDPQFENEIKQRYAAAKTILKNKFVSIPPNTKVTVPFADQLIDEMRPNVKSRRDFAKILSLIMSSALYYKNEREVRDDAIVASEADLETVKSLGPIFTMMSMDVSPKEEKILNAIRQLREIDETPTRRKIAKATGLNYSAVRYLLDQLAQKDLVLIDSSGREHVYDVA